MSSSIDRRVMLDLRVLACLFQGGHFFFGWDDVHVVCHGRKTPFLQLVEEYTRDGRITHSMSIRQAFDVITGNDGERRPH